MQVPDGKGISVLSSMNAKRGFDGRKNPGKSEGKVHGNAKF
jgi:hypothetical protein